MSWVFVALLACAVAILVAAEWPRLEHRFGESDDFAASVERDLSQLPTIDDEQRR